MRVFEIALAAVFTALGVRSLLHWTRRPFETTDLGDHLLYALFVTGRVGLWLALAGLFALYASTSSEGRAFVDDARQFDWMLVVIVALSALQFVAGFFLGRRSPDRS